MIIEEQIYAQQQRAANAIQAVLATPTGNVYGDYLVKSASGKEISRGHARPECL